MGDRGFTAGARVRLVADVQWVGAPRLPDNVRCRPLSGKPPCGSQATCDLRRSCDAYVVPAGTEGTLVSERTDGGGRLLFVPDAPGLAPRPGWHYDISGSTSHMEII